MSESIANDLIASLEAEGKPVDEGTFTIDEATARRKLAEYRLADRNDWACLIIEAAIAGGASIVRLSTTRRELELDFDGEPVVFEQVFGAALGSAKGESQRRHRANRRIALALDVLLDDEPRRLELVNELGCLVIEAGERKPFARETTTARNFVRVERINGWPEFDSVHSRCAYAPIHVVVDEVDVALGLEHALDEAHCTSERWPIELDGRAVGRLGWLEDSFAPSQLMVLVDGVLAETLVLEGYGEHAIVDVPLRKDLGEAKLLRNAELEAVLAALEQVRAAHPRPRPTTDLAKTTIVRSETPKPVPKPVGIPATPTQVALFYTFAGGWLGVIAGAGTQSLGVALITAGVAGIMLVPLGLLVQRVRTR